METLFVYFLVACIGVTVLSLIVILFVVPALEMLGQALYAVLRFVAWCRGIQLDKY